MTICNKRHFLPFFILLLLLCVSYQSRSQHKPNDLLTSRTWDIIGTLDFSLGAGNEVYPIFSRELRSYANHEFELKGYLIPIRAGLKQTRFLLSTLPVNQCFYCGKNGIPIMILVEMSEGVKFTYSPIRVRGKLKLKKVNIRDYPPILLSGAVQLN
jgi:hypothetical protein